MNTLINKEKEDWGEFIGAKKRTAVTWYSLGKVCKRCRQPIINSNESGHCKRCTGKKPVYDWALSRGGESDYHKRLKAKAIAYLQARGFDVKSEVKMDDSQSYVRFDIVGYKDGLVTGIECGGTSNKKMVRAVLLVDELLVWPYGEDEPYRWSESLKVCDHCGHHY